MSYYILRVYTKAGYHPDLGLHSISRMRAERRARRLRREGFRTQVLTVDAALSKPTPSTTPTARKPS
jgi:hypothetical protein